MLRSPEGVRAAIQAPRRPQQIIYEISGLDKHHRVKRFAKAGKMVLDFNDEKIRELIRGNYRIVYKIINSTRIDILTVHHTSRLLGNILEVSE